MRVRVEFDVDIPVDAVTDSEIKEWIRYSLNEIASMSNSQLSQYDMDAVYGSVRVDL